MNVKSKNCFLVVIPEIPAKSEASYSNPKLSRETDP